MNREDRKKDLKNAEMKIPGNEISEKRGITKRDLKTPEMKYPKSRG